MKKAMRSSSLFLTEQKMVMCMKRISEKDIAVTAAAAARNVKFVVSLETNLAQGVAAKLGRPNKATGIDVVLTEDTAEITIRLIIRVLWLPHSRCSAAGTKSGQGCRRNDDWLVLFQQSM